jgi:hypothetical protein
MKIHRQSFLLAGTVAALLALLLGGGCATSAAQTRSMVVAYEPTPSPVRIDASIALEASATMAPEMGVFLKNFFSDQMIDDYLKAMTGALTHDIASSGLFSRIWQPGNGKPNYVVKIWCEQSDINDFRLQVTSQVLDPTTRQVISTQNRDGVIGIAGWTTRNSEFSISHSMSYSHIAGGPPNLSANKPATEVLPLNTAFALQQIMTDLKADLVADLKGTPREKPAAVKAVEALQEARLPDLLVAADTSVDLARARNRAIVAAKNQQLPAILRDRKIEELSALVVKIEQTILDLNHEAEVAKDNAQQAVANPDGPSGRGPGLSAEKSRDLSISYRERIELLKPIAAAIKEEIANRSR